MKRKILPVQIEPQQLIRITQHLPLEGSVKICDNGFSYLDIDNNFIHQIYPLIQQKNITMPNYFGKDNIGAHITLTYPEEKTIISSTELFKILPFEIIGLSSFILIAKKYYVLLVNSPALIDLRRKYGLSDKLKFKNHLIDLHITVAVQKIS